MKKFELELHLLYTPLDAALHLIVAVLRSSDTKRMPPADQEKLRQLQQEIQRIGSPDPKDMPW